MIRVEKRKTEKYLFNTLPEAIVPIEVTLRGDKLTVETFRKTKGIAKEFYKKHKMCPFSDEAKHFIDKGLRDIASEWGYTCDDLNEGHIATYIARNVNRDVILESTVMIKSSKGYENLTEYELEDISEDSDECYFVTITEGKIVSVCETNSREAFIGAKEINVYTSPEFRGNGYAASNAAAMADHYASLGHNVAYTSRIDNVASIRTAEKCGFDRIAETFYYVCYKEL